ncbi:MAG: ABC transporter ATP-binding protein/permease [Oscillospiraceae bacterium]|jgi:ATP-binding cassette subfamily B protein|nr:ABC transporter ATP-binding protein/permease [Oscillospiraceae bacterium]
MKRIINAYRDILSILCAEAPLMVAGVFAAALLSGVVGSVGVWLNGRVFDTALGIAQGAAALTDIAPYLAAFAVFGLLPNLLQSFYIYSYVEPRSMLIIRSSFKGKMLQKLKRVKYEHIENEQSVEILDKAFNRVENSARHLFPMYLNVFCQSVVQSLGTLYLFASVKWWLPLTILLPFVVETMLSSKQNYNIYTEMEGYWKRERQYGALGEMLRSREFLHEGRLFGSASWLIDIYRKRLNKRNREYERFYFKNLKKKFTSGHITKIGQIGNALILLWLCVNGALNVGMMISLTLALFGMVYDYLDGSVQIFKWGHYHINTFDYWAKFFALSEDESGDIDEIPPDADIEFDDVRFKYPGTDKEILKGLTFTVKSGEKVSIVGQNGEGKTTLVKLLLGLFTPDSGEIRIGGVPLARFTQDARRRMFGAVFQDFNRYSVTLEENVAVGDITKLGDTSAIDAAIAKAGADAAERGTLLGREFEGGVDISGGQWQRVAIARAFMGDKPILILDEPTSQLDPMAESALYGEFAELSAGKTALFITHRLGSTAITDRILVIADGRVTQSGDREQLLREGGLYADMWNAQKQWYERGRDGND